MTVCLPSQVVHFALISKPSSTGELSHGCLCVCAFYFCVCVCAAGMYLMSCLDISISLRRYSLFYVCGLSPLFSTHLSFYILSAILQRRRTGRRKRTWKENFVAVL